MLNTTFPIGSISSGTLRPEDLIPAFASALEPGSELQVRADAFDFETAGSEEAGWLLEELYEALEERAPDYCYFGAHPDDWADFGFWISFDTIKEDIATGDLLQISDLSEIPQGHNGPALLVNDHGNMSLYGVTNGAAAEIWSVV